MENQENPDASERAGETENPPFDPSLLSQFTFAPEEQSSLTPSLIVPTPPAAPCLPPRRTLSGPARLLVAALGLGGMVDALFYGQQPGIGVLLFALLTIGALIGLALRENLRMNLRALLVTGLPLIFFAGMVALRDNGFLIFLNMVAALFLAGLMAHFFAGGSLTSLSISGFLGLPWLSFGNAAAGAVPVVRAVSNQYSGRSEGRQKAMAVGRGVLLAVPIMLILVPLLISADAVFAQKTEHLFGWLFPKDWSERAGRMALILSAAWGIAGGFVYALTRQERKEDTPKTPGKPLGFTEGMTPLLLVCTLFAGFLMVQAEYLFGGSARVQAIPGLTYAEYARRGFGELVTVAALTLTLALIWQRLMRCESKAQAKAFKGTLTLLVGLTLVLLTSAYQRMSVYEMAYGATETRLYVDAFIVFLGAVLVWFAFTFWTETQRYFAFGGFLCVLGYVASLNLLNPDAAVARTNIARSLAGKQPLEAYTVRGLSDDAIPALCAALNRVKDTERTNLALALRIRLTEREKQRKQIGWPSWNASRERAYQALHAHAAELPPQTDTEQY